MKDTVSKKIILWLIIFLLVWGIVAIYVVNISQAATLPEIKQVTVPQLIDRYNIPQWQKNHLKSISKCESGYDSSVVSASGLYYGAFQFSPRTFYAYGGTDLSDPVDQVSTAIKLYNQAGPGQWPVCQYK